ncbi:MAG: hypothetical protein JW839_04865 [Candidatus Lokiarchaeota archaeon]|nr:hypothetical protein [Candidatus Lokiarchaeota archaeon]
MAFRKFIVANLYLITIAWFVVGFAWMFTIALVPGTFFLVLPSFVFTLAGIFWLWAATKFSSWSAKPRASPQDEARKGETRRDLDQQLHQQHELHQAASA